MYINYKVKKAACVKALKHKIKKMKRPYFLRFIEKISILFTKLPNNNSF